MFFRGLRKKPEATPIAREARHGAVAYLPMKTGDTEAVESFARPLREQLVASALGDLAGYKMRPGRSDEPQGLELHLQLASAHPRALQSVGNMLDDMDAPVGSTIEFTETGQRHLFGRTEGVAVDLDGDTDWLAFAEAAIETLAGAAVYQGSRVVAGRRRLYFYGENATTIATALRAGSQLDPRLSDVDAHRLT
ncbi:MAG: hypothetical protein QNJ13_06450 [Paracoccaceae bacterium]|nr:hypothetical protein [Paracoccaceae bacterium]